jgi:hypothetical protein
LLPGAKSHKHWIVNLLSVFINRFRHSLFAFVRDDICDTAHITRL